MGGGSAKQRRALRRALKDMLRNNSSAQSKSPKNTSKREGSVGRRLVDWLEHPWYQLAVGILGTLLSVFYMPLLIFSGILILLSFVRAGVVRGQKPWIQLAAYALVAVTTFGILYFVRQAVMRSLPHVPTAQEIWEYFETHRLEPPPQTQPTISAVPKEPAVPFVVSVEVRIISPGQGMFTGYWVKYSDASSCVIWPIDDLLFLRVTNVQSKPKTVVDYSLEIKDKGKWVPVKRMPLLSKAMILTLNSEQGPQVGRTLNFPSHGENNIYPLMSFSAARANLRQAGIVEFLAFDPLLGGQTFVRGQTVRGWAAFHSPRMIDGEVRIKITDETGTTYPIIPATPIAAASSSEDLATHLLTTTELFDATGCTRQFDF